MSRGWSQPGELDLSALGRALWHKKWIILIPALVVGALAFVAVNLVTPRYKSESRILIEGRENAFLRPEAEKSASGVPADMEAVLSQVQILTSRDLSLQVIRQLKLGDLPEFGGGRSSILGALFGSANDPMAHEERVLNAYFERLAVMAVDKSRVIVIEFQSADPRLAARVANAIADTYIEQQKATKQAQTRSASQWLAVEIDRLRAKVAEAEQKVEDFRAKSNLFVGNGNNNLVTQQLVDLTNQLATARAQKAELDAKANTIRGMLRSGKPVESADVTNSDLLRRLIEQRVTLRAQLAEQSASLLDRHPRIQELSAQINALDIQITGELDRLVRSIENDARIAAARIDGVTEAMEGLKRQVATSSPQDVQLRALEREAKAERDLLESYLAKYREASARDSLEAAPPDARIISRATIATIPSYPKKGPIVLIVMLATMFLCAAFLVTGEILGGGTPAPRGSASGGGSIAAFDILRRNRPARPGSQRAAAAMGRMPIAELAHALRNLGEAGRRITVVGAARNVGTTYTALGLARALAQNTRVVLVDLALGAPNLCIISTNPDAPGIADLIRGTASFGDIVSRDRFSHVHLVATGRIGGEGAAILGSPQLATTLEALARAYDHVIIDAGAVPEIAIEPFARLAPRAVLVATDMEHPATIAARERLLAAGFLDVTVFLGMPRGPDFDTAHPAAA